MRFRSDIVNLGIVTNGDNRRWVVGIFILWVNIPSVARRSENSDGLSVAIGKGFEGIVVSPSVSFCDLFKKRVSKLFDFLTVQTIGSRSIFISSWVDPHFFCHCPSNIPVTFLVVQLLRSQYAIKTMPSSSNIFWNEFTSKIPPPLLLSWREGYIRTSTSTSTSSTSTSSTTRTSTSSTFTLISTTEEYIISVLDWNRDVDSWSGCTFRVLVIPCVEWLRVTHK